MSSKIAPITVTALKSENIIDDESQIEIASDDGIPSYWITCGNMVSNTEIKRIQQSDCIRLVRLDTHNNEIVALVDKQR